MKYAIIEASGKQYWVEPKKFIDVNTLKLKPGSKILIRRILFGRNEEDILIGQPYLLNLKIEAIVGKNFLGPKLIIYKMKPKKKYRRKNGHRQKLSRIHIETIKWN